MEIFTQNHLAPTDESIKIYDDFVKRARESVVKELTGDLVYGVNKTPVAKFVTFRDPRTLNLEIAIVLDGVKHLIKVDSYLSKEEVLRHIYRETAEIISAGLLAKTKVSEI